MHDVVITPFPRQEIQHLGIIKTEEQPQAAKWPLPSLCW